MPPWFLRRHRPPAWGEGPAAWSSGSLHKRGFLFRRFAMVMVPFIVMFLVIPSIVITLVFHWLRISTPQPLLFILIPLVFIIAAIGFWGMAFRRFGGPLAEVMAAADAVADGDFSVRVRENFPGEFGRLARSFNRMAAELQRADQQRRNLTADVAHELRTPLQIIQGNLEGILDGVYSPDPAHIHATLDETRLLSRLVSDLQTLSLAEAGQLPLHPLNVSAADLIADALTSFTGQAAEAGIEMVSEIQPGQDRLDCFLDPDRMDQVLSNLIANAIRHTPPSGKIVLRACAVSDSICIEVQDSGSGIPAEDLPFVFDRFYRGDRSRSRQPGTGSGLGLAIARQLVEAQGGKISVDSQPGSGTKFTLVLPSSSQKN